MGIGITAITGPEGGGKSCLMTAIGYAHHRLGGRLLSFPGYEIRDLTGKSIAEPIDVNTWAAMGEDLNNSVILIDEMQNFFNAASWSSILVRLFTAVLAQRRKRNLGIIYTTRNLNMIPKSLRPFNHILAYCWDMYWAYRSSDHPVPRGEQIRVNFCDFQGFFTGTPETWSPPQIFHSKKYWPLFNSYDVIDVWESFTKIIVKKRELEIDPWGEKPEEQTAIPNPEALAEVNETEQATKWLAEGKNPFDVYGALKLQRKLQRARKA